MSSELAVINDVEGGFTALPALVEKAADRLMHAKTSAEILEAKDMASAAYVMAKEAGRIAKAKGAYDDVIAVAHRTRADALRIEARAKELYATEYTEAQERGEVQRHGGQSERDIPDENIPSVQELGVDPKLVHEGRMIRGAEENDPGVVGRTLDELVQAGQEPTRARLREAVANAAAPAIKSRSAEMVVTGLGEPGSSPTKKQSDDVREVRRRFLPVSRRLKKPHRGIAVIQREVSAGGACALCGAEFRALLVGREKACDSAKGTRAVHSSGR
jgi:hypothetical protein